MDTLEKYTRFGRIYTMDTGQKVYTSKIGEQHIDDGSGNFLPFILKNDNINFGDSDTLEFASDKQIIKRAGETLCSSFKLFVQGYIGGQWVNQPHGVPDRSFREGQVFRDGEWFDDPDKCTGFLTFPDAALSFGVHNSYNLAVGIEAGGSTQSSLGFRFRAPVSGQMRFAIVLDGLQKLPTDWEWLWYIYDPEKGKEDRKAGIRVKDFEWTWTYAESPYRDIIKENNPDGTIKINIIIGPFDYTANEWLTVYPDTWGATGISDTNDDCSEGNDAVIAIDGNDNDGNRLGMVSGNDADIGLRWDNIPIDPGVTINTGCKIQLFQKWMSASGPPVTIIKGIDEADPAPWDSTHRPSQRAKVSSTVAWSPARNDEAWDDTTDISVIVDDIINGGSFANGNAIAFVIENDTANTESEHRMQYQDYAKNSSQAAKLTIVYTEGGGETLLPKKLNGGLINNSLTVPRLIA